MEFQVLPKIEQALENYKAENRDEMPLYIVMASDEADHLMAEVKQQQGYDKDIVVTEYKGSKIVRFAGFNPGEIRLTNELPDTSS